MNPGGVQGRTTARKRGEGGLAPALKPYDVRHERDRGRRRHLALASRRGLRVGSLIVLDVLAAGLALGAALLAFGDAGVWSALVAPVTTVQVLCLWGVHAYGAGSQRRDTAARLKSVVVAVVLIGLLVQVPPRLELTLAALIAYGVLAALALEGGRALAQATVLLLRRSGHLLRPVLVLGSGDEAQSYQAELGRNPDSDLLLVGHLTQWPGNHGALGSWQDLERLIHEHDIRAVILGGSVPEHHVTGLIRRVFDAGAGVISAPSLPQRAAARLSAAVEFDPSALELQPARLHLPELGLKRLIDVTATAAALVLLTPVFLVIAAAIRVDSRGPVLFAQQRLGVGGRPFQIYKFRTMVFDAEERLPALAHLNQYADGRLFKIKDDPRVTRVGRFLRRTSLDELPQLWNVLRGDMSLVGPRPPLPEEVAQYDADHLVRLTVVPGLTGPWQANGRSEITAFDQVIQLEREYIRNWSLLLDLRILCRTLLAVLRGHGAH
jgi:exopolysaccharide biosynthesis polyprenyl glycosylphosphotransferase